MKKTLYLILTVCAATAYSDTITLTPVTAPANGDVGGYGGWKQSLSSADISIPAGTTLADTVYLSSITIPARASDNSVGNGMTSTVWLVIYDGDTYKGVSSSSVTFASGTTSYTFSFDNIALSKKTIYTFSFATVDSTTGAVTTDGIGFRSHISHNTPETGEGLLGTNGEAAVPAYTAAATYVVSNDAPVAVPEPATATLSLLALAGLAARRRRK